MGSSAVIAQTYPAKSVRIVVGFPPGGTNDILARLIAARLGDQMGQMFIVENRAGANGIIGTEVVAKAPPDGYSLLLQSVAHAINASLYKKLPYDSIVDFAPVALLASGQLVLVVHPSLPVATAKELIALARTRPRALNYASTGSGGSPHLAMELFKAMARVDIVHIPYKGTGPAITDVLSGQITVMFPPLLPALPHITAGKLRPLAVAGRERSAAASNIPTMGESALAGFEASAWFGVFVPAKTPRDIVARLNTELNKALQGRELRERLVSQGVEPQGGTPEQFENYVKSEIMKWRKVVESSGARVE